MVVNLLYFLFSPVAQEMQLGDLEVFAMFNISSYRSCLSGLVIIVLTGLVVPAWATEQVPRQVDRIADTFTRLGHHRAATRGYLGQYFDRPGAVATIAAIFGPGKLKIARPQANTWRPVTWRLETGEVLDLGHLKGNEFRPRKGALKLRDRVIGEGLAAAMEQVKTSRYGRDWRGPAWIYNASTKQADNFSRTSYEAQLMARSGYYLTDTRRNTYSDALDKLSGPLSLLKGALESTSAARGGLSLSWTAPAQDQYGAARGRARHHLVFHPVKWRSYRSEVDQAMVSLFGRQTNTGFSARHEVELLAKGQPPQRKSSRRQVRARRGWIKDQLKRYKQLKSQRSPVARQEAAIATGLWHLGFLSSSTDGRQEPLLRIGNAPNLMISMLLGQGTLQVQGRRVYWRAAGSRRRIGTLTRGDAPTFKPYPAIVKQRNAYLGRKVLAKIFNYEFWTNDYDGGYRFERRVVDKAESEQVKTDQGAVPRSQTFQLRDRMMTHILDSVAMMFWHTPISDVINGVPQGGKTKMCWTSKEFPLAESPGYGSTGAKQAVFAKVPEGHVVKNELTFTNEAFTGHRINYKYTIVEQAK